MSGWSQSHFLQSLGWATLNSFWQMGLLWCSYLIIISFFKMSSERKYQLSVLGLLTGFVWFSLTFVFFFQVSSLPIPSVFQKKINGSDNLLNIVLLSASITYLLVLIFPSYLLFRNWRYIRMIKTRGLNKADLNNRLFVQRISAQLGIKKKVFVYLSEFVKSPVTIGYLKPIILLPVAAFNNLSCQQAEAVLLHELSHIKRYDYLINLFINFIHTILYFNPFVKQFIKAIEEERENCCDQLVIQYGYNKISYATALLGLEKMASQHVLVMGAADKKYLLNRIEKITGMEKKNKFRFNHFTGILAAFLCILVFNSILIIKDDKRSNYSIVYNDIINPLRLIDNNEGSNNATGKPIVVPSNLTYTTAIVPPVISKFKGIRKEKVAFQQAETVVRDPNAIAAGFDEIDGSLSTEQKAEIRSTVEATKKVVGDLQWQEVENNIADAMTEREKSEIKLDYIKELNKAVNWKNVESNLKAKYQEVDWTKINTNLARELALIQIDSVQKSYNAILTELDKSKSAILQNKVTLTPLPDQSLVEVKKATIQMQSAIKQLKALKKSKVIVKL